MINFLLIISFKIFYFQSLNITCQGRNFALIYLDVGTPKVKVPIIITTNNDKLTFINIPGTNSYDIENSSSVEKTSNKFEYNYPYIYKNYNISSLIVKDILYYQNQSSCLYFGYSNNTQSIKFAKEIRFPLLGIIGISKTQDFNDKYNFINQLISTNIIRKRVFYFEKIENGTTYRNITLGDYPEIFEKNNNNNTIFECKMIDEFPLNRICKVSRIIFGSFNSSKEFHNNSIKINEFLDFTYNSNNYHIFPLKYKEIFDKKMKETENCSYIEWYFYSIWSCEKKEEFPKISFVINHTIINVHHILFETIGRGYPALIILFQDNINKIELSVQQMAYKGFSILFDDEKNIVKFFSNNTDDIIKTDYDDDDDKKEDNTNYLLYFIIVLIIICILVGIDIILLKKKPQFDYHIIVDSTHEKIQKESE